MSTTSTHGKKTKILFGSYDLSQWFREVDIEGTVELVDTTCFDQTAKSYIPGFADGKSSLSGLFGAKEALGTVDEIDEILSALLGVETDTPVTIGQAGVAAVGDTVSMFKAKLPKYSVKAPAKDVVSTMAELQAINGIRVGKVLAPLGAQTATASGASVDNSAATSSGAIAHLHCTAASASDTLDVIIEDSADGATWATIGTFAQVAASSNERLEISGNVRRYVRATWTIAGTAPSFTFSVALARIY
jgi:hypothetical protein